MPRLRLQPARMTLRHAAGPGLTEDRRAISALEYALLAMFVGLAVLGAETQFGRVVRALIANDSAPIVAVTNGLSTGGGSGSGGSGDSGGTNTRPD